MESMNKKNYQSKEEKSYVVLKQDAKSTQTDATDETFANHKFVGIFYLLERKKSSISSKEGDLKPFNCFNIIIFNK